MVGTDLSRPRGLLNCRQGRDKSVPTETSVLFVKEHHYALFRFKMPHQGVMN